MMNQLLIWFYLKNLHLFKNWLVCVTTYMTTRYYIEQQKVSEVFLFLVQTNIFWDNSKKNCKGLAFQGNFVVSVLPESSRVVDYDICCRHIHYASTSLLFYYHQTRYIKRNYNNCHKSFTLVYCRTEIPFENYGIEYVKFVIRRLKFGFSGFFFPAD